MLEGSWPEPLVRDIARRRTILVIGSGVSRNAVGSDGRTRPPVWKEFLQDALTNLGSDVNSNHIKTAIESGDLLHACEWLKDAYDEDWTTFLRSKFVDPQYKSGELHELIAKLDTRVVFSLNFDEIYENKSREINEKSQFVKNYNDSDVYEFLRGDARYVVKVHGNISSPSNLIFTQEDYARARVEFSNFYKSFDAALMTHTFLFIGCGYGDPDINLLLENQSFNAVPGSVHPHYFLTTEEMPKELRKSLRKNRNLKILTYKKDDRNHQGLVVAVRDLLECVTEAKADLLENNNW